MKNQTWMSNFYPLIRHEILTRKKAHQNICIDRVGNIESLEVPNCLQRYINYWSASGKQTIMIGLRLRWGDQSVGKDTKAIKIVTESGQKWAMSVCQLGFIVHIMVLGLYFKTPNFSDFMLNWLIKSF